MSLIALASSRGVIAVLGYHNVFGLTTFATNILTMLAIAAGTDYGIFLIGRYQEALRAGEDRNTAYYTTFRGAPRGLGFGSDYCRGHVLPQFYPTCPTSKPWGPRRHRHGRRGCGCAHPRAGRACRGGRFGLLRPKDVARGRLWRRVGTAVVRWPAPFLPPVPWPSLSGVLALPGFKPGYNDRYYLPNDPGQYRICGRGPTFLPGQMNPDTLMVEADHDMRNPADMLVLDRVAKNVQRTVGVARYRASPGPWVFRFNTVRYRFKSARKARTDQQTCHFQKDRERPTCGTMPASRENDRNFEADDALRRLVAAATHDGPQTFTKRWPRSMSCEIRSLTLMTFSGRFVTTFTGKALLRHSHCWAIRSLLDAFDGIDKLTDQFVKPAQDLINSIVPAATGGVDAAPDRQPGDRSGADVVELYTTSPSIADRGVDAITRPPWDKAFDTAKNDDFFYLPPEAFDNPDFIRG